MTFRDLEWPFHGSLAYKTMMLLKELNANINALSSTVKSTASSSRAISAVAELLVCCFCLYWICVNVFWTQAMVYLERGGRVMSPPSARFASTLESPCSCGARLPTAIFQPTLEAWGCANYIAAADSLSSSLSNRGVLSRLKRFCPHPAGGAYTSLAQTPHQRG